MKNRKQRTARVAGQTTPAAGQNMNSDTMSTHNELITFTKNVNNNNNKNTCNCWVCRDILQEEIKSVQKSLSHTRQDTNKILSKLERLEAYFL